MNSPRVTATTISERQALLFKLNTYKQRTGPLIAHVTGIGGPFPN